MRGGGAAAAYEVEMLDDDLKAVIEPELTTERAFKDFETILYSVAASPSQYRNSAVHYMRCRNALLNWQGRPALPGFVFQCGTCEKFRDFITLYDASVQARHAFIHDALGQCRSLLGWTPAYDIFDDEDF
jgi:hypothetical protein